MIRFYYHPTPNPAKVALFLEETGLAYEVVPVDTAKGEQHLPAYRAINPNGKVPAIVDTEGPAGAEVRVFNSERNYSLPWRQDAALHRVAGRSSRTSVLALLHRDRTGSILRPGVHFQHAAPEKIPYGSESIQARSRATLSGPRRAPRWARLLSLETDYTIVDMSAWGWLDRAGRVLPGETPPLNAFPNLERWFKAINSRPAVGARTSGRKGACVQERSGRRDASSDVSLQLSPCGELTPAGCRWTAQTLRSPRRQRIVVKRGA